MKNRKADVPVIGVTNIGEYVSSRNDIANRHFIFMPDGSQYFCIKGELVPANELDNVGAELQNKGVYKGNSLDGRTNWIE